jgi:hypothetical protein
LSKTIAGQKLGKDKETEHPSTYFSLFGGVLGLVFKK